MRVMGDSQLRAWVKTWERAGAELELIKRRELEAMTDADVRAHVDALFTGWIPPDTVPANESGLVQQQRWFARAHRGR